LGCESDTEGPPWRVEEDKMTGLSSQIINTQGKPLDHHNYFIILINK
jgi:hypothetical protein